MQPPRDTQRAWPHRTDLKDGGVRWTEDSERIQQVAVPLWSMGASVWSISSSMSLHVSQERLVRVATTNSSVHTHSSHSVHFTRLSEASGRGSSLHLHLSPAPPIPELCHVGLLAPRSWGGIPVADLSGHALQCPVSLLPTLLSLDEPVVPCITAGGMGTDAPQVSPNLAVHTPWVSVDTGTLPSRPTPLVTLLGFLRHPSQQCAASSHLPPASLAQGRTSERQRWA